MQLELIRAALRAGAESLEQLAGWFATGIPVALQERVKALLAETAGIEGVV